MVFVPLVGMYKIQECEACSDLDHLLEKIDCTLLFLTKKEYNRISYNLDGDSHLKHIQKLLRYKSVIIKRKYNCTYPSDCISTQNLITQATILAFRHHKCSECTDC